MLVIYISPIIKEISMLVKIDSENYLNTQHIVAVSTFTSPDGNVKSTNIRRINENSIVYLNI